MKSFLTLFFILNFGMCAMAQDILIPYRQGKLWGFCNETGKIIIQPAYDSVSQETYDPFDRYRVMKNNLWGVVSKSKTIIKPSLHQIQFYRNTFIVDSWPKSPNSKKSNLVIYDYEGRRILKDTLEDFDFRAHSIAAPLLLFITKKSGLMSLFSYDIKSGKIGEWLYEDVRRIDQYYEPIARDETYYEDEMEEIVVFEDEVEVSDDTEMKVFSKIFIGVYHDAITFYEVTYDETVGKFKLIALGLDQYRNLKNVNEPYFYRGGGYVAEEMPSGGSSAQNLVYEMNDDSVFLMTYSAYYSWRKSTPITREPILIQAKYEIKPLLMPKDIEGIYYEVRTGNRISAHRPKNYLQFEENNKFGIVTPLGTIPAQYDSVVGIGMQDGQLPRFIVGLRNAEAVSMKFGIIDFKGDSLLPLEYDKIEVDTGAKYEIMHHLILTKNGKQSVVYRSFEPIINNWYDEIIPTGNGYDYIVRNGNLYGLFDSEYKQVETKFTFIPKAFVDFGAYGKSITLVALYNQSGKFMGYGNKNGKLYFAD